MSLSIPLKSSNFSGRKSSESEQISPLLRSTPNSCNEDKSSRSGNRSNKSSFSRTSKGKFNKDGNLTSKTTDSSDNFGMALQFLNKSGFPSKFRQDFDRLKEYEDTAIKIINEKSLTIIKEPEDAGSFSLNYSKTTHHTRTIFLDLEDTLVHVSLYPQ